MISIATVSSRPATDHSPSSSIAVIIAIITVSIFVIINLVEQFYRCNMKRHPTSRHSTCNGIQAE